MTNAPRPSPAARWRRWRHPGLRDPVEGGFFRYAVQRDWTEPHYERMLSDNAQLLAAYTAAGAAGDPDAAETAEGLVAFLLDVLRSPQTGAAFASAQDSESLVDGAASEGGYYALDADGRAGQPPPGARREGAHRD